MSDAAPTDKRVTADGKTVEPRRTGDTNKKANNRAGGGAKGHADPATPATGASSATGVTPLLLARLHGIFERVQGAEIGGEADVAKRSERLRTAAKEAHVISRTASALPSGQRAMVIELADNVKAVVATLRNMTDEEVARSVEVWQKRQAAKAAAPSAGAANAEPAPAAEPTPTEEAAAKDEDAKPATLEDRVSRAVARCRSWLTLFAADEFTAATIAARKRTIALASADINAMMAELEELGAATNLDDLLDAVDKATDAVVAAKADTVKLEKLKLPREQEDGDGAATAAGAASAADADTEAGSSSGVSLAALNEVLTDFHEALNAEHIMEVDAQLRATTVAAIVDRLREIEAQVLPTVEGSEEVRQQAAAAVATLMKRAQRIQEADAGNTKSA